MCPGRFDRSYPERTKRACERPGPPRNSRSSTKRAQRLVDGCSQCPPWNHRPRLSYFCMHRLHARSTWARISVDHEKNRCRGRIYRRILGLSQMEIGQSVSEFYIQKAKLFHQTKLPNGTVTKTPLPLIMPPCEQKSWSPFFSSPHFSGPLERFPSVLPPCW